MPRRDFLKALAAGSALAASSRWPAMASTSSTVKVAFGSCALEHQPQPIWQAVKKQNPDMFVFLGDTIYADTEDMQIMRAKYDQLNNHADFAPFRASGIPIVGTWDDHDFGANDYNGNFALKQQSKLEFMRFYNLPPTSPLWSRDGVYSVHYLQSGSRRVQIILLDLRYFRSPFKHGVAPIPWEADPDPQKTMLGETQWAWFEEQLKAPADFRIIGSSITVLPDHSGERWSLMPLEKAKLFATLDRHQVKNFMFISGDTHCADLGRTKTPEGREILEFTSSGLNREGGHYDNPWRLEFAHGRANFGLIEVDFARSRVRLEARGTKHDLLFAYEQDLVKT